MFVTVNKLSHELNLPSAWLRTEAKAGRLPSLSVGRRLLFDMDAVRQALEDRTRRTGSGISPRHGIDDPIEGSHS